MHHSKHWVIFGWFVFTLCLYDTCETLFLVNFEGLYPDKFRGREERVKVMRIGVTIGMIGVAIGNLLPPMIVVFGDVGISPLYTFNVMFGRAPINGQEDVIGALSLVLYTLILIPLVKYVLVVLLANDDGEGMAVSGIYTFLQNFS